jgi:hypothetical protein
MRPSCDQQSPIACTSQHVLNGFATGGLKFLLRAEGFAVLAAAVFAFSRFGSDWGMFAWYFLAPDLAFFAYLGGSKFGALAYNTSHSCVGPVLALSIGIFLPSPMAITLSLIWFAHIGMDRALGYGLKYFSGFGYTHLGPVGKVKMG